MKSTRVVLPLSLVVDWEGLLPKWFHFAPAYNHKPKTRISRRIMSIKLLSTIDLSYQVPLEVMASSLLEAKHDWTRIEWHIVVEALDSGWQSWLDSLNLRFQSQRATFRIHELKGLSAGEFPLRGRARRIMYARLVAPEQLHDEAERLLYLDADMLVMQPIENLWEIDLGGHVCGCCQDLAVPYVSSPMGIKDLSPSCLPFDTPYFNAGVMLIDTKKWRNQNISSKALAYLERNTAHINLYDQEALNAALEGDWLQLSCRWNLITSIAGRPFVDPTILESEDYQQSLLNPCILHFAGTLKPWLNPLLRGRWHDIYRSRLNQTILAYRLRPKALHYLHSSYDKLIRNWTYPVERKIWQLMRGF